MREDPMTVKLNRALLDLGDTPDAVAAVLEANGCRYVTGSRNHHCPVAQYLQRVFPEHDPSVGPDDMWLWGRGSSEGTHVDLPMPVQLFVRNFDHGHYPALQPER